MNKNLACIINLKETLDKATVEGCKAVEIRLETFGKIYNPDIKHDHCKNKQKTTVIKTNRYRFMVTCDCGRDVIIR